MISKYICLNLRPNRRSDQYIFVQDKYKDFEEIEEKKNSGPNLRTKVARVK